MSVEGNVQSTLSAQGVATSEQELKGSISSNQGMQGSTPVKGRAQGVVTSERELQGSVSSNRGMQVITPVNERVYGKLTRPSVIYSDAYKIAVQNGFDGTVDEWLESLKGEPGPQGEKGDRGDSGADGYTPVKGIDYFTEADKAETASFVLETLNPVLSVNNQKPDETGNVEVAQYYEGENISISEDGKISVLTADSAYSDNTRPITSAAVATQIGNIEILLNTI